MHELWPARAMRTSRAPWMPAARRSERSGTLVYGSLPALDVDKWLPLFGAPDAPVEASALDVQIGQLDLYGKRLNEVSLRGGADAAGWPATIASQEIAGDLSYRTDGGGRLVARLTRLLSPQPYPGAPERGTLEPKDLPTLDLVAERFSLRGKELGRVEIQGGHSGEDWRIDKLAMTNADATLAATGTWRGGAPNRSQLDFELNAADAGQFLARVGYPNLVKGGKTRFRGNLAWNGDPSSIDYASLTGSVKLESFSGQFLEIEPGIGKLVSLMSLQNLPRRLSLDFRDVFSKGFQFDRITGNMAIERGVMGVKEFHMNGPAADVSMTGQVDLSLETQTLAVRVVPQLGDTASTVVGLVNPLVGVATLIAGRAMKNPLGKLFAYEYTVSGTWTDPKVEKVQPPVPVGAPDTLDASTAAEQDS